METTKEQKIYLAGGCFWCLESLYTALPGIKKSVSGYMGGHKANPSYEAVCTDTTGHAEVVELTYDPSIMDLAQVLDWFWKVHDPTSLNRQGNDVGSQYRSEIFYTTPEDLPIIQKSLAKAQEALDKKIVTKVSKAPEFWPAEAYHQDYFKHHPENAYCQAVIKPKVSKLLKSISKANL